MRIEYIGERASHGHGRAAWIHYNEDDRKDAHLVEETCIVLESLGWRVETDYFIPVYDRENYDELVVDYKYAKSVAKEKIRDAIIKQERRYSNG